MAVKMISDKQKRIIWSIAKKALQLDSETLYTIIFRLFGKEHMRDLLFAEGEILIAELQRNKEGLSINALTAAQYRKIMGMAAEFGWSATGLQKYLENEVGVSNPKWLDVVRARIAITGLEKIRSWKESHPQEAVVDGVR